jgi:hypothetical protein
MERLTEARSVCLKRTCGPSVSVSIHVGDTSLVFVDVTALANLENIFAGSPAFSTTYVFAPPFTGVNGVHAACSSGTWFCLLLSTLPPCTVTRSTGASACADAVATSIAMRRKSRIIIVVCLFSLQAGWRVSLLMSACGLPEHCEEEEQAHHHCC